MARPKKNALRHLDVFRFSRLCDYVDEGGHTLTEASRRLDFDTPGGLSRCLNRLEQAYGPLVSIEGKRIKITQKGRNLKEDYDAFTIRSLGKIDTKFRIQGTKNSPLNVGASPFLLAHMLPRIVVDFLDTPEDFGGKNLTLRERGVHVNCLEAYYLEQTIESLQTKDLDCAIMWDYDQRAEKILRTKGLTCLRSKHPLEAVVVFGQDHEFRKKVDTSQIDNNERYVYIDELSSEQVLVLEKSHQPFGELLPPADVDRGGRRIQQTTILSIISAIRSGLPAVAIVPGIYFYLNRYRRDGSLFSLPLKDNDFTDLSINIIYAFRGQKITDEGGRYKPAAFNPENLQKSLGIEGEESKSDLALNDRSKLREFLQLFESVLEKNQSGRTGWDFDSSDKSSNATAQPQCVLSNEYINLHKYENAYYVTSNDVGLDVPRWIHSKISFDKSGMIELPKLLTSAFCDHPPSTGMLTVERRDSSHYHYNLVAWMISDLVLSIWGNHTNGEKGSANRDSFVANLYVTGLGQAPGNTCLIGVWSGRDNSARNALTAPFMISKKPLTIDDFKNISYKAMLRTLTNVSAKPPHTVQGIRAEP